MMNIYKRPLFRQAGGPAAPMATDMPAMAVIPPEMQAQVQQAEQSAAGEMEGYGRAYVDEMMTGLDSAESAEEVINAIRGNAQPIDSRYDELAGIVGIEDARATPESVLALVQPTMMMTEQGAMDTGIGELMQSLTGGVEMEDEQGMATPMGQGVGELMMGAPAAEPMPVQQYNMGGPVVKMFRGGDPNSLLAQASGFQAMTDFDPDAVRKSYEARAPLYEELLGDTENRRKQAQSSLFFDIAKAGLNLAGGVDPSTGQSMTGAPLGAQIARAAMPVAESAQRAGAEVTDAQRGARVAALQSAEAEQASLREQVGRERTGLLGGQIESGLVGQRQAGAESLQASEFTFRSGEADKTRVFQKQENESDRDFNERINNARINAEKAMLDTRGSQALAQILKTTEGRLALQGIVGEQALAQIDASGDITLLAGKLDREGRMALQELMGTQNADLLEREISGRKTIFELDTARRSDELRQNHENTLERDYNLDFNESFRFNRQMELEQERIDRSLGGTGMLWWKTPSVAERGAQAQDFMQKFQTTGQYLGDEWNGVNADLARDQLNFERLKFDTNTAMKMAQIKNQAQIAALAAMEEKRYDFGNSIEGITKNMVSDMELLQAYSTGSLDRENPDALAMFNTALTYYAEPKTQFNSQTGQFEQVQPVMPRQLSMALKDRQDRNLSTPFANGGEVRKFQLGGAATSGSEWNRVNEMLNPSAPMTEQDIELPGRIIPENPNLTPGVGFSTVLSPIRTVGSYARELGLMDREAPFSEISDAQTQLNSLANVTQRFVRESVGSKVLKSEVDALAEELGKPGFSTEEATLEKLTNMRNQLLEVEDLATSILETPEKFTTAQVTTARQDVRRLSPLIENYDRAIMNFETSLNPNKPDPAMFEGRGANLIGAFGDKFISDEPVPLEGVFAGSPEVLSAVKQKLDR
jgi:hypothetical protein